MDFSLQEWVAFILLILIFGFGPISGLLGGIVGAIAALIAVIFGKK